VNGRQPIGARCDPLQPTPCESDDPCYEVTCDAKQSPPTCAGTLSTTCVSLDGGPSSLDAPPADGGAGDGSADTEAAEVSAPDADSGEGGT
jgi:hypothetical protein